MKYLSKAGLQIFYNKYLKPLKNAAYKEVANDLITETDESVLDARQGKVLDDKKFNTANIAESTEITEPGFVMDGKTAAEAIAELNSNLPGEFTEYQFKSTDFSILGGASVIGTWTATETGYLSGFLRLCTYYSGDHTVKAQLQGDGKIIQCAATNISSTSPAAGANELVFGGQVTKGVVYSIVTNDNNGGGSGLSTSRLVYRYL